MKKQILTLTMCLALTTTAALAAETKAVSLQVTPQTTVSKTTDQPKMMTREDAKKHFEERRLKSREKMYNDLGLSQEQRAKADELDNRNKTDAIPLFQKFKAESKKLNELKAKKASAFEIWGQEIAVRNSKTALKRHYEYSTRSFEAILTKEQRAKFEARKKEMNKFRKNHKQCEHKKRCELEHMGPPPGSEQGPEVTGPNGPQVPEPMGPPPENKK